jgi:hypothetical protein
VSETPNILRAVALALDPNAIYDNKADRSIGKKAPTSITLEFTVGPIPSAAEKRLLDEVDAHEKTLAKFAAPSLASEGKVHFWVELLDDARREMFLTRDPALTSVDPSKVGARGAKSAGQILRQAVRFVDIKSGEELDRLLQRGFKEILGTALTSEHGAAMQHARNARQAYIEALGEVLRPVARHVRDEIRKYVRGIQDVDLIADVPPINDALADAKVMIEDAVNTPLDQKGTGVRGAMLLLLLSFIAESSKSAVVFCIEEPEAFLHPEAHRALGAGLGRFTTQRAGVSMLVTTHSPFLVRSAEGDTAVFHVTKGDDGRSSVAKGKPREINADLLGSEVLSDLLDKVEEVPDRTKLILVVEGQTDCEYLEQAAQQLGISIKDIHIAWQRGATAVTVQATAMAARHSPGRAVAALFDTDDEGRTCFDLLSGRFSWKNKAADRLFVLNYERWLPGYDIPVEAEDIFDNATILAFLADPANKAFCTGTKLRHKSNRWHYDLSRQGKIALVAWLEQNGTAAMFEPWRPVLEHLLALAAGTAAKGDK